MKNFQPDYRNIEKAARNIEAIRMPLYEHNISEEIMETITNKKFLHLYEGKKEDKREYFRNYVNFFRLMGYDTVSFERCIGPAMPGSGSLGGHKPGVIKTREDFDNYPWKEIPKLYFDAYVQDYQLLKEEMPKGMKAIGGPGNGVFECVQDVVGYTDLCYMAVDDPELYDDLFKTVGNMMYNIWDEFMKRFNDTYCVLRFGDDMGFRTSTLIDPNDIRRNIIPQYKKIIDLVHLYNKPFLLHSCGEIFNVMDDLIKIAKIDAKHSNEDQIAPFSEWIDKYGDKIGNFGGIELNVLCLNSEKEIKEYVKNVMNYSKGRGGIAIGSGNSIPNYIPVEGYLAMIEAVRELRE